MIHNLRTNTWIMTQTWNHLLFMHIPVPQEELRGQIPNGLELDTYDGEAWISIIPFKIKHMRLPFTPPLPLLHSSLELNVRTYVRRNGETGVYFFSLDTNQLLTVLGGRLLSAPYRYATIRMSRRHGWIYFETKSKGKPHIGFTGKYRSVSRKYKPDTGSLAYWLVERYIFWTERDGSLYRGTINHEPWELYDAEAIFSKQAMLPDFLKQVTAHRPVFHYAKKKKVYAYQVKKVEEI
ncbi:YqjF family protein [Oceanobacillus alkalisoli]|uniref:YqjF family protein n=1 Tax=Oceanobacillus alkalisoli TaxID=2925113 RepID=UPI001EE3DD1B|nr:DUF2071 domain-containing protein [Oceanobacillus alkalisoli]MCG5103878.1 DUF2071 domain-containing protein [Oceanobacillus alkalisoli]